MTLDIERKNYPRVSDILSDYESRELRKIPLEILANAAERGSRIHNYCTGVAKNLWVPPIDKEALPYVESFQEWWRENVFQLSADSIRLYDDEKKFSGKFDMIVVLKSSKQLALIDLKTSATISKSWPIQLAAYKHLCERNHYEIEVVMNVQLKATGKIAKTIEYENLSQHWNIFQACLTGFDYFRRDSFIQEEVLHD